MAVSAFGVSGFHTLRTLRRLIMGLVMVACPPSLADRGRRADPPQHTLLHPQQAAVEREAEQADQRHGEEHQARVEGVARHHHDLPQPRAHAHGFGDQHHHPCGKEVEPQRHEQAGQDGRQDHVAEQLVLVRAHDVGHVQVGRRHRVDLGQRRQHDDEEHRDEDQKDRRHVADAEDEDRHRQPGHRRDRCEQRERGQRELAEDREVADRQTHRHRAHEAQRQAQHHAHRGPGHHGQHREEAAAVFFQAARAGRVEELELLRQVGQEHVRRRQHQRVGETLPPAELPDGDEGAHRGQPPQRALHEGKHPGAADDRGRRGGGRLGAGQGQG
eukprot:Opistho-1_new@45903